MKELLQGFVVAFSMYSRIPMPGIRWTDRNMKYCLCYFPLIGFVIGLLQYLWFHFAVMQDYGIWLRTGILVLIPVLVTGGIHLDGLLDTADALASYKSQEERLEILKDSHVGAFAVIAACSYFILQYGVFSEVIEEKKLVLTGLGYVLSRALSGFALVTFKKAKNTGLLRTFSDAAVGRVVGIVMLVYIFAVSVIMLLILPSGALAGIALAFVSLFWYRQMAYKKFGGITGDLAGCFLQICELAIALGVILA